jgi:hypothetical protein
LSDKYIVLDGHKWQEVINGIMECPESITDLVSQFLIPDAVVLRKQDVTVAPLLHTYASIILSFIEVGGFTEEEENALLKIGDWAHSEAISSESLSHRKLPD